jgi:iron complex transport system substrate-binding protein
LLKAVKWLFPLVLIGGLAFLFIGEKKEAAVTGVAMREFQDSAGRKVNVPVHPKRVIALNASNLDLYYAAGGTVVGRPTTVALSPDLLSKISDIPQVGETSSPNLEKILELKPDLVLGVDVAFNHTLAPVLEKAGIPILLQALPDYQSVLATITAYGELTGTPEKAAAAVATIERQVQPLRKNVTGKAPERVLLIWGSPESFNMALPSSFAGNLLSMLGAVNIADTQSPGSGKMTFVPLSLEYVAKANPDVILLITHGADERVNDKFQKELAAHPAWKNMQAVKNQRVHKLPYALFAVNPGTQVGMAVELLVKLLYPEEKS